MGTVKVKLEVDTPTMLELIRVAGNQGLTVKQFIEQAATFLVEAVHEQDAGRLIASVDRKNRTLRPVTLKPFLGT